MSETDEVYVPFKPGDLITAESFVDLQRQIREDIVTEAQQAADGVEHVATATDASTLEGRGLDDLTNEIIKRVLDAVRTESGYRKVFRVLEVGEFDVIEHGLGECPLVDVYLLEYFEVVCREDDDTHVALATFYLHHTSEKRVRAPDPNDPATRKTVDIQPPDVPFIGIPFREMLERYEVSYTDTTSLEDLENEFWKAFLSEPNDPFDDTQYCHSPWFERCCRDQTDVASLKARGDWDDIWFQVRPWKIIGGPVEATAGTGQRPTVSLDGPPIPANVGVAHLDLNRVMVWLQGEAIHAEPDPGSRPRSGFQRRVPLGTEHRDEVKAMILLRA